MENIKRALKRKTAAELIRERHEMIIFNADLEDWQKRFLLGNNEKFARLVKKEAARAK